MKHDYSEEWKDLVTLSRENLRGHAPLQEDEVVIWKEERSEYIRCAQIRHIQELLTREYNFNEFVEITKKFLEKYPASVFTGESGDPGPLFVVGLRKLIEELENERGENNT